MLFGLTDYLPEAVLTVGDNLMGCGITIRLPWRIGHS